MNHPGQPSGGVTVAVAFSGGRDSLALLHATVRAARALGLQVVALHVHHGLMAEADAWVRSAIRLCARWQRAGHPLRLRWHRLEGGPARGDSVEAWARRGRYQALAQMAREEGAQLVLLAHHRRDQAETVLLQALRGAGPRGLAAMPALARREGLTWARPWLDQPREAIEAYVRRHRLRPIDDPSNDDDHLARSRLRRQVWPALAAAFGDAETTLAAVARRAQEADAALAELAALDLAGVADAQGLRRQPWLALSPARRANVLRAWLRREQSRGPAESLVQRLLAQWPQQARGRWPAGPGVELVAWRGALRIEARGAAQAALVPPSVQADLSRPGPLRVPGWPGILLLRPVTAGGLDVRLLQQAWLAPRRGGERFQRAPNTPPRSLKKQFQLAAVPAHARQGPLVWLGPQLAFVPGLGVDARMVAESGVPQLQLTWQPDAA